MLPELDTVTFDRFFRHTLGSVWSRQTRDSSRPRCYSLLNQAVGGLKTLNKSTEQDFLSVGGKLAEFSSLARQISSDMKALSELGSGEAASHASQVLAQILQRCRRSEELAKVGDQALAGICDAAGRIGRTLGGFRDTVTMFQVLGPLTRIETARHGVAGTELGSLAEEVHALTRNIESSGQAILNAASVLDQNMRAAIARVRKLRADQINELPSVIAEVTSGIESLAERHRLASEESTRLSTEYGDVSASIGDLITALQFHDITRQQLEHVAEALERLRLKAETGGGAPPADLGAVATLQTSQVSHASRTFHSAVGRIEGDLDRIALRIGDMAADSQTMMGASADEQNSFFLQLEGHFTAILRILDVCAQAEAETQRTLIDLRLTLARIRQSVDEIREIEIRIHRIALNATIRATQIGDGGNALCVLAEVMQRLALDSDRITEQVGEALDTISGCAGHLGEGALSMVPANRPEADRVLAETRATIFDLHSSSESSFCRLTQVVAFTSRLLDGVRTVRAGFSAGTVFAQAAGTVLTSLRQLASQCGAVYPGKDEPAAPASLDEYTAHYTMETERKVHHAFTAGAAPHPAATVLVPALSSPGDDLGDNVELF